MSPFEKNNRVQSPIILSDFTKSSPAFSLKEIPSNASGITWNPYLNEYWIIQNNAAILYRYDRNFYYLGQLKKVGNMGNDTEGISVIDKNQWVVVTEDNQSHHIYRHKKALEHSVFYSDLDLKIAPILPRKNKSLEGVAFRKEGLNRNPRIYTGQEGSARYLDAKMRVFYYDLPKNRILKDHSPFIQEPFNAESMFLDHIRDISGMTFDPTGQTLIIVSQESHKAIQINPDTGEVLSQLPLSGAPAYEGVTFGPNGELVFVSERNFIQIYTRQ
jgi:uncharacterized protein YjiK